MDKRIKYLRIAIAWLESGKGHIEFLLSPDCQKPYRVKRVKFAVSSALTQIKGAITLLKKQLSEDLDIQQLKSNLEDMNKLNDTITKRLKKSGLLE